MNATLPSPAVSTAAISPVEYVRGLTPEEKEAVFLSLLRETAHFNGNAGPLPIHDEDGKSFLPP